MTRTRTPKNNQTNPAKAGRVAMRVLCAGLILAGICAPVLAGSTIIPTGIIELHSEPAGAYACIDGDYCQYTFSEGSAYFYGLDPMMPHTFTVSKVGFGTMQGQVMVDPAHNETRINATLPKQ